MFPQVPKWQARSLAKLVAMMIVFLSVIVTITALRHPEATAALSARFAPRGKPNEIAPPTPWPTVILPPMTPVPTRTAGPPERPIPPEPIQPHPTPKPSDPYQLTIYADGWPDTGNSTRQATTIVIGTVEQVAPARWSTADGQRPANPWVTTEEGYAKYTIFRPVLVRVEQYLKGQQSHPQLLLFALGGTVGRDSVEWASDDLYTFREGERVLVFLVAGSQSVNGRSLWNVIEHYTITEDERAINSYHSLPLQRLIDEIRGVQGQ